MKIIADSDIPFVKEAFADFGSVYIIPANEITRELCKDASILLVRSVTKVDEALLEGSSIKFVATATIGTDHIDTVYLADQQIGFASAPGSNANSVAEYVIAAILQLAKRGKCDIRKSTLGIIGAGNVGSRVFKMAESLGIRCLLNDPPKKRLTESDFYVSLEAVLEKSDIISLHVPLTFDGPDKTVHMVNENFIASMRDHAILINTSRGKVLDEAGISDVIERKIGGLVLDVWENEPAVNLKLLTLADIATAHIAGYSFNGKINGVAMVHDAACAFFYKEKRWYAENILKTLENRTINLDTSKNPIDNAVESAYSIMRDTKKLKKIVSMESEKQRGYFKEIRRNYPQRLEFPHFSIPHGNIDPNTCRILEEIGFSLM